jgi:hypothetical protein
MAALSPSIGSYTAHMLTLERRWRILPVPYDVRQNWRAAAAMILVASVPPMMPGLINSINTNIHVGGGTRLFDLAYLLGVSAPRCHSLRSSHTLKNISIESFRHAGISSLWHRPSISRSRFPPLAKPCSITQSWSRGQPRRGPRTTGAILIFLAAMKRSVDVYRVDGSAPAVALASGFYSEIQAEINCALRVWNPCHF